jgi:hypothetical protein
MFWLPEKTNIAISGQRSAFGSEDSDGKLKADSRPPKA